MLMAFAVLHQLRPAGAFHKHLNLPRTLQALLEVPGRTVHVATRLPQKLGSVEVPSSFWVPFKTVQA